MSASPYRRPLTTPPRPRRGRSPWLRAALAGMVVAMLPFAWSEDFACDHAPHSPVSGLAILFGKDGGNPGPGAVFLALLVVAVGLGFVARTTWRVWRQLACDVVAGVAGLGAGVMCLMMMKYGRDEQPLVYPAAWFGTLAAAALAGEAWWTAVERLHRGIEERRIAREAEGESEEAARDAEGRGA